LSHRLDGMKSEGWLLQRSRNQLLRRMKSKSIKENHMKKSKQVLLLMAVSLMSWFSFAAEVDTEKSVFQWRGSKKVGDAHTGKIFLKDSTIELEGDQLRGGSFVMDLKTFTVEDLEGKWAEKFLNHMKSSDFFEVEKWPTAQLVIVEVTDSLVKGNLTIKDKTEEVSFPYTQKEGLFSGKLVFDRTKFGMIYGSGDFFKNLGDKIINNEVELTFEVVVKE
jgi:polyisoprenoid-binding protein YceI